MSSKQKYLSLRLTGPLQSWAANSPFNHRQTGLFPTKSAIAGLCCAALGAPRGSEWESSILDDFRKLRMEAIAIPRKNPFDQKKSPLSVGRLRDYHTVERTRTASKDSIKKNAQLTYRFYLEDAEFGVVLSGDGKFLDKLADAIKDPKWGIWLGRKACIPAAPVFAGIYYEREQAYERFLNGASIENFTRQVEVDQYPESDDSIQDQPKSFGSVETDRLFESRNVRTIRATVPP